MNKRFFSSLLLGFGATLGVLVAVAMPPGGWGVAIGVGLGLLCCIPLFVISMMVLTRDRSRRRDQDNYEATVQQPPIIIVQQPALPYGNGYAQPQYELYDGQGYVQLEVPEGYEYYPQGYLAQPQPRQERRRPQAQPQPQYYEEPAPQRLRSGKRRAQPQPGYYAEAAYPYEEQQYYYNQPEAYYPQPVPTNENEAAVYGYYDANGQPQYYQEQNPPIAQRSYSEADYNDYYNTYQPEPPRERRQSANPRPRRNSAAPVQDDSPVVDGQFRTIGGV